MQIDMGAYDDKDAIVQAINGIRQDRGSTATDKALKTAREAFNKNPREGAAKLIIVFTDGESNDPFVTAKQAKLAHHMGINVFAIGIGEGPKMNELRAIASDDQYVFSVNSFEALQTIKFHLSIKACEVEEKSGETGGSGKGE